MLPPRLQALLRQGQTFQTNGQLMDAASVYAQLREAEPCAFEGWHYGGMAALLQGRADIAEHLLARGLELNPTSTLTAMGLGVARVAKGDALGAEKALRAVVAQQPKLAEAWRYLALALETQGRIAEALEAQKRVVVLNPRYVQGWTHYGATLSTAGRPVEALACYSRALELDPADLRARLGRALMYYKCHRVPEAAAEYAAVLARDPNQFEARSCRLLALNNLAEVSREQLFDEHVAYGRATGGPVNLVWPNTPEPARRLRVAFFSSDFREHSVAYFIEPLLRHLDAAQFELVLYHNDPREDAVTARLRTLAARWRNFANQVDEMVEPVVKTDSPDIAVDLTGHTGTNRLRLFARRVAPVQVTYLGYPNTTGVPAMDYRFVDQSTDPLSDADRFSTEKLVRFAPSAWAYLPPAEAPEVAPVPAGAAGHITFGSFNNLPKVTDAMLRVWARVIQAAAGSRLLLKAVSLGDFTVREPVFRRIAAAGLPLDRIELLPRTPDTLSHLALYSRVDVTLDTFPYHGTTTTCESLWMGVPVVTRVGDRHASRVGVSLLTAAGHPEWIAEDDDRYVRIALDLANDRSKLAVIRRELREQLRRSVLFDHADQARRFGAALRDCWMEWCKRSSRPAQR